MNEFEISTTTFSCPSNHPAAGRGCATVICVRICPSICPFEGQESCPFGPGKNHVYPGTGHDEYQTYLFPYPSATEGVRAPPARRFVLALFLLYFFLPSPKYTNRARPPPGGHIT